MLSNLIYVLVIFVLNIDFVITQYLFTFITVVASALGNHYIYGFGSEHYNTKIVNVTSTNIKLGDSSSSSELDPLETN